MYLVYGSTEVGLVAATPISQHKLGKMIGKISSGVNIRLHDKKTGQDIDGTFQLGEVLIKHPGVKLG